MKPIALVTHMICLLIVIEASEYPQRKESPLFKVEDSSHIDYSVIGDIFVNSGTTQYSGTQKVPTSEIFNL